MHERDNSKQSEDVRQETDAERALLSLVRCLARAAAREFVDANRKDRADG